MAEGWYTWIMNKADKDFTNLSKKYGPGFIAYSKKNGRVLAHGGDIKKMYEDAERKSLDLTKVVISHVPKYGVFSAYFRG